MKCTLQYRLGQHAKPQRDIVNWIRHHQVQQKNYELYDYRSFTCLLLIRWYSFSPLVYFVGQIRQQTIRKKTL